MVDSGICFEKFLNKVVTIVKKDGFINYGTLRKVHNGFLELEFNSGRHVYVAISEIATFKEGGGNR